MARLQVMMGRYGHFFRSEDHKRAMHESADDIGGACDAKIGSSVLENPRNRRNKAPPSASEQ
jgi:hypothetical protein